MPRQFVAGVAGAVVPAEDIGAGDRFHGGVRSGVRSDVSIVCVDTITEPLLSASVCDTVPLCGEAGALTVGSERTVSVTDGCFASICDLTGAGAPRPLRMP